MQFLKSKVFLALALGLIGILGLLYFFGGISSGDIGLTVTGPEKAPRLGEPFDLKVGFTNNSKSVMKGVRLSLKLPPGAISFSDEGVSIEERELGEIKPGGVQQDSFKVVATPFESNSREFTVSASYSPESLVARFEKTQKITVSFAESGLNLDLKSPNKVFSEEEFEITLEYKKSNNEPLSYKIKMAYPETFVLTYSSADPSESNNIWKITKDEGKITLRGKVDLPDETDFSVKADIVATILDKEYVFASKSADLTIAESPLALKILLPDASRVAYYPGEELDYTLSYKNNTQVELQGLVLSAQLLGAIYNFQSLKSQGGFNSLNNTISWDSKSNPELKSIGPGATGVINFSLNLKNDYPIRRLNDKNFTLKVKARIESPTVPYLISSDKTVSSAVLETKVGGKVAIQTKVYFRDAASGILNSGPSPPRVGVATDFTVHLILTNFSTDISGVEIKVPLQDGVVFSGKVKGNTTSLPEVSESGEVVWKIDRLFATAGVTGDRPEAIFQITATPRSNFLGSYMTLLGETSIKAHDEFTGLDLSATYPPVTTRLPDDPTISERDGIVVQ